MTGTDFLADTNAILYFLSGHKCMAAYASSSFAFSIISEMELLSWSKLTDPEEKRSRDFLSECAPVSISENVKETTIRLRKKYNIKLPDAVIAASAIESGLPLLSADIGFEKIQELKFVLIRPDKAE